MNRLMLVTICSGVCLLAASPAWAQEDADSAEAYISQAVAAYDAMDYDRVLPLLSKAEQYPAPTDDTRITILKYRAFVLIMEGKEILARDAVTSIFELKPDFELPSTVSPKFRRFFAEVKRDYVSRAQPAEPRPRVITANPAAPEQPAEVAAKAGPVSDRPNWFVRFWPSWTCLIAGTAMLVPGTIIGLDVKSGRDTLNNAPKDDAGHIIGMSRADAQKLQDDADKKGLTSMILLGAGGAAVLTGAVMFFVYDGATNVTTHTSVSFETDGTTTGVLKAAWVF